MKLVPEKIVGPFGQVGFFHLKGKGQPLLMFHASGAGNASLLRLAGMISERTARPIWSVALDGYPGTRMADGETALDRHKAAVRAMLDHVGEAADLFGHSLGGFTSLNVAREAGAQVASVTVVEPVAINTLREHAEDADALELDDGPVSRIAPAMAAGNAEKAIRGFIEVWNGVRWQDMPQSARDAILKLAPQILEDTNAIRFAGGFADDYRIIACPVHLIGTGRSPETARAIIRRLHDANPHWQVTLVEEAGHMGPIEQPDLFAPLIG
jgi:pimeloyl-ACP methyl ester carboxylesterase